jgi:hypothetical protein
MGKQGKAVPVHVRANSDVEVCLQAFLTSKPDGVERLGSRSDRFTLE